MRLLPTAPRLLTGLLLTLSLQVAPLRAQPPYQLNTGREVGLLGLGAATGVTSLVLEQKLDPLTATEVNSLNRADINAFDRRAAYQYSTTASHLSDATLLGNVAVTGLLTLGTPVMRREVKTVGVMFLETLLLANGVQRSIKNLTERTRPYVYNPNAPLDTKLDRSSRQSFFSGHTTNAFATAVFTGEVFRHYFPASRFRGLVWGGSLGLATATAVLRYEAGMHYPTDLIAGAAFGSLVGWGIPKLHEVTGKTALGRRLDLQPWSNGQSSGIYARMLVFSR